MCNAIISGYNLDIKLENEGLKMISQMHDDTFSPDYNLHLRFEKRQRTYHYIGETYMPSVVPSKKQYKKYWNSHQCRVWNMVPWKIMHRNFSAGLNPNVVSDLFLNKRLQRLL